MSVCKHKHILAWHSERVYVSACSSFRMCLATIGSGWFAHACTCIEPKQSKFVRTMRTLISLNLCDLTYVLTTTAYLHTYAHIATKHACTHRHTHKLWLLYSMPLCAPAARSHSHKCVQTLLPNVSLREWNNCHSNCCRLQILSLKPASCLPFRYYHLWFLCVLLTRYLFNSIDKRYEHVGHVLICIIPGMHMTFRLLSMHVCECVFV